MRLSHRVLNMPEWVWVRISLTVFDRVLNKSQYVWIYLNNTEYDFLCQHRPEKTEYWIFQNSKWVCCFTYYKVTVQITEQLSTRQTYSEHCQTFKMERFAERIMKFFRAGRGCASFWNYGTSINISKTSKTQEKETPQRNIFLFFFLDALSTKK